MIPQGYMSKDVNFLNPLESTFTLKEIIRFKDIR
jgi:hypothetical protein